MQRREKFAEKFKVFNNIPLHIVYQGKKVYHIVFKISPKQEKRHKLRKDYFIYLAQNAEYNQY